MLKIHKLTAKKTARVCGRPSPAVPFLYELEITLPVLSVIFTSSGKAVELMSIFSHCSAVPPYFTLARLVQLENAKFPMLFTLAGIVTLSRLVHWENA